MDGRAAKFDWNRARAFLVAAEAGSLSAAARALGMAQPTLSRQVAALEHELRVTLFERVGRGLELTDSGRALLEHVRGMGEAASRMALSAAGEVAPLKGTLAIAASELMGVFVLPPLIARLRQEHPTLEVKLLDATARDPEIAIVSERPGDATKLVRRVRDVSSRYYATPAFLKQSLPANGAKRVALAQSPLVAWELVKHGLGTGAMLERVGDAEPQVERVSPDTVLVDECWLVAENANTSRAVRTVFEFLAAELS